MGRYYNTNNFEGKFGFAVQDSTDPEIFGMAEQPPASIDYYLEDSEEAEEHIRRVLDEQYDILKVPKKERVYSINPENQDEEWKKVEVAIDKQMWRPYDPVKDKDIIPYAMSDETCKGLGWKKDENGRYPSGVPVVKGMALASCRVYLGIKILSDLIKDGYCDLNAEI